MFTPLNKASLRAFELLSTPLYVYGFDSQSILWSNESARHFWDSPSAEELQNRKLTPYSTATQIRLEDFRDSFRNGEARLESWTYYPKGIATSALVSCRGVRIDGHDEAMLVEIRELTSEQLPEAELRSIEILRHTPLKISLYSEHGAVLIRNPAARHCFAEFDKTLEPGSNQFRATFANAQDYDQLLQEAAANGSAQRAVPLAVAGAPIHAVQLTMVSDPATGRPAMLTAQQDISELVEITRLLAASEAALDAVLSLNVTPALVLSARGDVVLKANFAAQAMLGAGLHSDSDAPSLFAEEAQYEAVRGAILAGGGGTVQMRIRAANGSSFWASISGARISYEKQDAFVLLLTDIDHLYKTAQELEAALDIERHTSETQRRYLAIASHEFRTPLAIIDGAAQRLQRHAEKLTPDRIQTKAVRIRSSVKRLLQLLDSTLERASRDLGAMGYSPERTSLENIIAQVVKYASDHTPGLDIQTQIPQLPELNLDSALLEQALTNLLNNAIKYSNGIPKVRLTAAVTSEAVQLDIRDYGIGIPEKDRSRVFSDYFRASNVGDTPGTGLGLSLVHQIIVLHDGAIDIVDTDGPGTTFRITFPRP